ncbi:hypothetical protein UlMin_024029 [Ulmus minor]
MKIHNYCLVDNIPDEILIKILSKLPAKTLIRCMCVCKEWKSFIVKNKTHLIDTHLRQSSATKYPIIPYVDFNDLSPKLLLLRDDKTLEHLELPIFKYLQLNYVHSFVFIGSCNGLVCFNHWDDCTALWNPVTGDKRLIPDPMLDSHYNYHLSFGFDHINNDYKLVRITEDNYSFELRVEIFRLSTNSWREVKGISGYEISFSDTFEIVNEVLYLLGAQHIREDETKTCILRFNLCCEEFQETLDLPCINDQRITFSKWKESFSMVERSSEGILEELEYNFWIMNDGLPGTRTYSWTKLFKITGCSGCGYISSFLGTCKDQLVFHKYVKTTNHSELTFLDAMYHGNYRNNHTTIKNFGTSEDPAFCYIFDYVESLIPVNPRS